MRLQSGASTSTSDNIRSFSEWTLNIGDGTMCESNDGYADICIPDEFLISNFLDPIKAIVEDTYPDLIHNYLDSDYFQSRAILASTIEVVDDINKYIINLLPGEDKEYFSSDSIDKSDATNFDAYEHVTPEFLNALKNSGLPNHSIRLKVNPIVDYVHNQGDVAFKRYTSKFDKVDLDKIVELVSDLPDPVLDLSIKEAFNVAYSNI
ncbi:uncharacterized protein LOC131604840 [Vicia villosa]|uniref:uncharacterized protein LOC131604840 n=1 Tax=Vicia villosa TaxID=3911 RepID=UPI00273C67A3|nr:uncharacterized protein LOC131604840 [Vicia villosa]